MPHLENRASLSEITDELHALRNGMRHEDVYNRFTSLRRARYLASSLIVHQRSLGVSDKTIYRHTKNFLVWPEYDLIKQNGLVLPSPRTFPYVESDLDEGWTRVRPGPRWGNAWNAKAKIEEWLANGESVSLLAGKFRVFNSGEANALSMLRNKARRLVVAVASDDLCGVAQEFAPIQWSPFLDERMQPLVDLTFPDGKKIDYVFHNDADHFFLAHGETVNYLPFYFFHLPTYEEQSEVMLSPKIRDIDRNHRARRIALWHSFARMRQPSPEQRKAMTNFRWALSQDPVIMPELRMRERIFNAFGGRVQRLPMNANHQLVSSTALIERFRLNPEPIVRNEYFREEQLTPIDRENLHRVKRLSRQMAEDAGLSQTMSERTISFDESMPF